MTLTSHQSQGTKNVCIYPVTYLAKSDWLRGIVADNVVTQYDLICLFGYSIHLLINHITSLIYMFHRSLMFVFLNNEICIHKR